MVKAFKYIALAASLSTLTGCVTQNYENSKKPVIQNDTSNTDIAMTRVSLGLGYLKMGNTTQAKLNLEKAKRFAPNLVQVYTAFAHYYETVGEDELTVASYEKALSIKPDDADTLNNFGVYLCRQDRLPEAEVQFLRAIAVPSYLLVSQSYENLALCQLRAPNFEKAETYLSKAIDHNPSNASSLYQMMRLLYAKGEYPQALAYSRRFEKATRRFNADSLSLSYKIYQKLGDTRIAKNYGNMLVKMFPESFQAKQYLLNELAEIEADQLAEKYQLLKVGSLIPSEKKRVVKISPNNKPAISINSKRRVDADKSAKRLVEVTPPTENEIKAQIITRPTKKTVVLKSPQSKGVETMQTPSAEPALAEDKFVEEELSTADALAMAQAELAEIDKQLSAAESGETIEDLTSAINDEIIEVSESPADADNLVSNSDDNVAGDMSKNEAASTAKQHEITAINEETVSANNVERTEELENNIQIQDDSLDEVVNELTELDSTESEDIGEPADDNASLKLDESTDSTELIEEPPVSTEEDSSESNSLESEQALEATDELIDNTEAELVAALENSAVENDLDMAEELVEDSAEQLAEDMEQVGPELAEQAPVYMSLEELPQHVIAEGENLFSVSKRYNIRLNTLIKWNELDERALVKVGDVIYLTDPSVVAQPQE